MEIAELEKENENAIISCWDNEWTTQRALPIPRNRLIEAAKVDTKERTVKMDFIGKAVMAEKKLLYPILVGGGLLTRIKHYDVPSNS